jgi:hypothetical protein
MFSNPETIQSEIYVFLKLLAEGSLNATNANLNAIPDVYYPLIKILGHGTVSSEETSRVYLFEHNIRVLDNSNGDELLNLPVEAFVRRSKELFDQLQLSKGQHLQFPEIREFLQSIDFAKPTSTKQKKADIHLMLRDININKQSKLGFSTKHMLSGDPVILNANTPTNFIYRLVGNGELDVDEINAIESMSKVLDRVAKIKEKGYTLRFEKIESETFQLNLELIDSCLPLILAHILLLRYFDGHSASLTMLIDKLITKNPLGYNLSHGHPFYEYKIKNLLTESILGMGSTAAWTGVDGANNSGIIIVKEDRDLIYYQIFNRAEFQQYLIANTRLETASTYQHRFGEIYTENGKLLFKLNLQIRFT